MHVPLIIAAVDTKPGWGAILMSCCPGRTDLDHELAPDIAALLRAGAAAVVTLNDDEELDELGVAGLGRAVREAGMEWFHLPIDNYCAPDAAWMAAWPQQGAKLRALVRGGRSIHIHCRAGCGRTGAIAARLLVELGICDAAEAIRRTRFARPCAIERTEQEAVVHEAAPLA